jgi:hypothetical protein
MCIKDARFNHRNRSRSELEFVPEQPIVAHCRVAGAEAPSATAAEAHSCRGCRGEGRRGEEHPVNSQARPGTVSGILSERGVSVSSTRQAPHSSFAPIDIRRLARCLVYTCLKTGGPLRGPSGARRAPPGPSGPNIPCMADLRNLILLITIPEQILSNSFLQSCDSETWQVPPPTAVANFVNIGVSGSSFNRARFAGLWAGLRRLALGGLSLRAFTAEPRSSGPVWGAPGQLPGAPWPVLQSRA